MNPNIALQQLYASLSCPIIFNDARDEVLKQWNQLLALYGHGEGYFNLQQPPVKYTQDGLCTMLKTICYNSLVKDQNEDGILLLICNQTYAKIFEYKQEFAVNFNKILGNKPNVIVNILNINSLTENKCCISIKVIEKTEKANKIIPCNELLNFFAPHLNQPNSLIKNQLHSLAIEDIKPKIGPTFEKLQMYLSSPPANINPKLWESAVIKNPDPVNLIPVPVLGLSGLNDRLKSVLIEHESHKKQMDDFKFNLSNQKMQLSNIESRITSLSRRYRDIRNRLIKAKCCQDTKRLSTLPLQMFEVDLRNQLENIRENLCVPSTKSHKSLASEIREQKKLLETKLKSGVVPIESQKAQEESLEPEFINEFKQFLSNQQVCLDQMAAVIKQDCSELSSILKETSHQLLPRN